MAQTFTYAVARNATAVSQGFDDATRTQGQRRPADVIGNAVKVMKIATGEEPEDFGTDDGKDKAAQSLGQRGGNARARALSKKRRSDIARRAAKKWWST